MKQRPFFYHLGNAFMAFSLFLLAFIYYPIVELYFFPQPVPQISTLHGFYIEIPKIHVLSPIIPNVDPFNDSAYHEALTRGVALSRTGVLPGHVGTVYIFAHSSDFPWRITRYNTIFYRIGELHSGDSIAIVYGKKTYHYRVTAQKIVWPGDIAYITNTKKNQLILQTCTPIGTSLFRLLVFATPL